MCSLTFGNSVAISVTARWILSEHGMKLDNREKKKKKKRVISLSDRRVVS